METRSLAPSTAVAERRPSSFPARLSARRSILMGGIGILLLGAAVGQEVGAPSAAEPASIALTVPEQPLIAAASASSPSAPVDQAPVSSDPAADRAQPQPPPTAITQLHYPVTRLHVEYAPTLAGVKHSLPPIEDLAQFSLLLGQTKAGLGAPDRPGARQVSVSPMGKGRRVYCGDGLLAVSNQLVKELNKHGIFGVYVLPEPSQIDSITGEDRRAHKTDLTLQIYVSVVNAIHTVGHRVPLAATDKPVTDSAAHARILANSPIVPVTSTETDRSLLREGSLQDYLDRINRFPGRRVDTSVSASDQPGQVTLDFLVREQKPWTIFAQTANTGTHSTGEWRTHVGFEDRQLLRLDDTLHLDYTTSDFTGYQSASFSYDFTPIFPDYLKVRTYFNWGRYSAADIGVQVSQFNGQTFTAGESLTWTPFYIGKFPFDITGGLEWQNIATSDETSFGSGLPTIGQAGNTNFLLPFVGVATERNTDKYTFSASLEFQSNLAGLANTDRGDDLAALGRPDVDRTFYIGKLNLLYSTYLEPLFFGRDWDDQKVWWKSTRAHEFYVNFRGQETFDDGRLVPQLQFLAGGFNSVRGYPESFAVGDSGFAGTVEYRLHVPRLFCPADQSAPDGKSTIPENSHFAWISPHIGSLPDWDLIFRTFCDAGFLHNNGAVSQSEEDRTLVSVGAGLELQFLKPAFLSVRADWGVALQSETEAVNEPVRAGSSRVNVAVSLSF